MVEDFLVSVIIPVFNIEKYIDKCIKSVIEQSYRNIEIILVDDGSLDSSGEICDHYSLIDNRIHVLHIKNSGVSHARNCGMDSTKGELICFIDGDDYVSQDYIEYLVSLIRNKDGDIAYSENIFTYPMDKQLRKDEIKVISGEEAAIEQLCYKTNIGVWNKVFRKSILNERVRFIETQFIGEGFNFNVSAFQLAKSVIVGKRKVYFYRQDNFSSATKKFTEEKWLNGLESLNDIKRNMIIKSLGMQNAWIFAQWRTNADIYISMGLNHLEKTFPVLYRNSKNIAKKNSLIAFKTNSSWKNKIEALIFRVNPKLIFLKIWLKRILIKIRGL